MSISISEREDLLVDTLADMTAREPAELTAEDPFDCDALDGDADHTIGLWKITWSTASK